LEAGFEDVLKNLQASQQLADLAIAVFKDAWNGHLKLMQNERVEWRHRAGVAEKGFQKLADRILKTESQTVRRAIEAQIEELEREKIVLVEKAGGPPPNVGRFDECIELALKFLSRPWGMYKNGILAVRQTVHRLVFSRPLTFTPEGEYQTKKTTLPIKILGGSSSNK
jgi:hypothetical protein